MRLTSLEQLFMNSLQVAYYAKSEILMTQQRLTDFASDETLIETLKNHQKNTREQLEKLKSYFDDWGIEPKGNSDSVDQLIQECETLVRSTDDAATRDVAIAETILKAEHLEIALLSGLAVAAKQHGYEIAEVLEEGLQQDEETAEATKEALPSLV